MSKFDEKYMCKFWKASNKYIFKLKESKKAIVEIKIL